MKRAIASLTAVFVLGLAGATIGNHAHAAAIAPMGLRQAADELTVVDTVQFIWGGRPYCWYNTGWRGPGWYRCGFRWRSGLGWGGPVGWHGWHRPGVRPGNRPPSRPGVNRPGGNRPGVNRPGGKRPGGNRPSGSRPRGNQSGGNG